MNINTKKTHIISLTGGPCAGKTAVLEALEQHYPGKVLVVPEVATLLLEGGFPVPGRDLDWSEEWQAAFQSAILPLQHSLEEAYLLRAAARGHRLVIADRGMLDGAAYTPGGVEAFCERYHLNEEEAHGRYAAVLHLESLATAAPDKYGKGNNEHRFEPLERAQALELATRAAWHRHPNRQILDGERGVEGKVSKAVELVGQLLEA